MKRENIFHFRAKYIFLPLPIKILRTNILKKGKKTKSSEESFHVFLLKRRDLWRIEKFHRVTSADSIRRAIGFFFSFFPSLPLFHPLSGSVLSIFRRSVASIVLAGTINVPCWRESLTRFTKSAFACDCVRTRSIPPLRKEQCVENVKLIGRQFWSPLLGGVSLWLEPLIKGIRNRSCFRNIYHRNGASKEGVSKVSINSFVDRWKC